MTDGMDDWMEEKRGEVMGRKNSKVKFVRGEERTRGKLVEDLSTTGSLHTGGRQVAWIQRRETPV